MNLQSLVLSGDREVIKALQRAMEQCGAVAKVCTDPARATQLLSRGKFEAVVLDCDNPPAGAEVLRQLRTGNSNRNSVVVAITRGTAPARNAFELGANFVLEKPLTSEALERVVRTARGMMLAERRRYIRYPVEMPVRLTSFDVQSLEVKGTNLSHGGVGVLLPRPIETDDQFQLRFRLPDSSSTVDAKGQLAWMDPQNRAGIRFLHLAQASRNELERWLAVRNSRQQATVVA